MIHDRWKAQPLRLKFHLGEYALATVTFPALVQEAHFTQLPPAPTEDDLPVDRFSPEVELILLRSHPVSQELPRLQRLPRAIRYVPKQFRRYYVDLSGSFDEYLQKFSGKSRSTLLRKVRRFAEFSGGESVWREYRTAAEMPEFHHLARVVSLKTYQERLLEAGMPDGDEFCRQMEQLAEQDLVRGYILFHGGQPIAYLYCPCRDGVLLYQYLGYDPEFARWSPGTVLQHLALERLFTEGMFRMFDFTEGEGAHKEFFSTGSVRCADLYYFRPTRRNLRLLRAHASLDHVSGTLVRVLDRLGLKARVKRFLRKTA